MSKSKQKGTAWETAIVRYLNAAGFDVERRALSGINDKGDVSGLEGWVLEAKAEQKIDLAGYMTEAEREAANAGVPYYAAVVKRRMRNVQDGYVVMPLKVFARFLLWWSMPVEAALDDINDPDFE